MSDFSRFGLHHHYIMPGKWPYFHLSQTTRWMKALALHMLGFWMAAGPLFGQSNLGQPFIQNHPRSEYRAGTQNWAGLQGPDGRVFFANNEGLLEFNGKGWHKHPLPNRTILRSVALGRGGRLFVGGQNELGYFEPDSLGRLAFHDLLPLLPPRHRRFEDVWNLAWHQGQLFAQTSRKVFRIQGDSVEVWEFPTQLTILRQAADELFLHDQGQGLLHLKEGSWVRVRGGERLQGLRVTGVVPLGPDSFLVATFRNGLLLSLPTGVGNFSTPLDSLLRHDRINCLTSLNEHRLLVGTMLGGAYVVERPFRPLWHLDRRRGLLTNNILAAFTDRSGNLWLAQDNGIDYVLVNSPFTHLAPDGELEGSAYAAAIHRGRLYLGTTNGIFAIPWQDYYDPLQPHNFQPVQNTTGQAWSLCVVHDELFAGHHDGAFHIRGLVGQPMGAASGVWTFLPVAARTDLLLAGTYRGLDLYQKGADGWHLLRHLEGLEESSRLMTRDPQGFYWMAHPYRGIYRILLDTLNLRIARVDFFGRNAGLPSDLNNHVFLVFGEILVAAERGIYRYDSLAQRFVPHPEFDALFGPETKVRRLWEGPDGNLWFVTQTEAGFLEVRDEGLEKSVRKVVLPQLQERLVGGFELIYPHDAENVFIGVDKGFIHYNPRQDHRTPDPPLNVLLDRVELLHPESRLLFGGYGQDIPGTPELKARENAFRFSFCATEFGFPDQVTYRVWLEGFEQGWSPWSAKSEKEYTNLPPGTYTFHVQARTRGGALSPPRAFSFRILPPWYATPEALLAYALLIGGLLVALVVVPRRRFRRETALLKDQQRQIEEQAEKALSELRHQKLEAEIRFKNQELATTTMHLVQKTEFLEKVQNELKRVLDTLHNEEDRRTIRRLLRTLQADQRLDEDWERFAHHFDQVHADFLKRLRQKHPDLTLREEKLCAYLRMNLSSKDIASLMSISVRGVEISRYRLRKKLGIPSGRGLPEFLQEI